MTPEELAKAQELLKVVSDELADLNYKMGHTVEFTQQGMARMQELQPIAFACRQKIGLAQAKPAQPPTEAADAPRVGTAKRRTDEQGAREQGVKLRPSEAKHPPREREALPNRLAAVPSESIANIFNKSVEDLSSSVPSSAGRTPPSTRSTFQGSASSLPTGQAMQELSVSPPGTQVLLPSDPKKAALIGEIKFKLQRTKLSQSTPPPRREDARSTPSSLDALD